MESLKSIKRRLCTFCYKTINQSNDPTCDDITGNSCKFVTLISRHLLEQSGSNVVKPAIFLKVYESLHKFTKSNNLFNYVQICKDCEVTTQNFCKFYQTIKELEMLLDFEISKLWNTMQSADDVSLKVKQVDDNSTGLESCDASTLIEFRKTLKQNIQTYQSSRKTKSAPRVYLSSLDSNDSQPALKHEQVSDLVPRVFSPINLEEPMNISHENDETHGKTRQDGHHELDNGIGYPLSAVIETSSTISEDKDQLTFAPFKKNSGQFRCTSCPQRFSAKCSLDQHNILKHIEKYFPSAKLSSFSNSQFKAYLDHTIDKTLDDFPSVESKYKCPYCYIPKLFVERRSAKVHLILHHRSVINEKLIGSQTSYFKQYDKPANTFPATSRHFCSVCSKTFQDTYMVQRHKTTVHPEVFIKASKLADEDDETFRTYVGYVLEQQVDQQFVKLKSGLPSTPLTNYQKRPKHKCKICSKILHRRLDAKSHIISKHNCIIVEKLSETRNSDKTFKQIKFELAKFKHGGKAKYCPPVINRKIESATSGQYTDCTICKKKTGSSYNLSRHKALHHPEHFFVSVKSELVTDTQFSLFVKHLYSQELSKFDKIKGSVGKKEKYRCNYCPNILETLQTMRVHVLLVHYDKLAETLKGLQSDLAVEDMSH